MNIGVLIRESGRFYSDPLLSGAYDYCSDKGIGMTVFAVGRTLPTGERSRWRDFFLTHMRQSPIDALVCVSSTFVSASGESLPEEVLASFGDMPKVSLGVPLRSAALVSSDPEKGINELLEHLAVQHGCRRFGFIGGPSSNFEGKLRFGLFRDRLRILGIEFDEGCRFEGDFEHGSGGRGVEAFRDRGLLDSMDAIVCANDHMALGAWRRLHSLGVEVPGRIALAGFDDAKLGLVTENPLTTVNQGIRSLGYEAVRSCHEAVLEGRPAEDVILPTRLVVRGSCGCIPDDPGFALRYSGADPVARSFVENSLARVRKHMEGTAPDLDEFRNEWTSLVTGALQRSMTVEEILGIAWNLDEGRGAAEPEGIRGFFVPMAMRLALEIVGRERFISISASKATSDDLDKFGYRIFGLGREEDFGRVLEDALEAFGFSLCMIGVFESRDGTLDRIRPIACRRRDGIPGVRHLDSDGTFPASDLLPEGFRRDSEESLMVLSLGQEEGASGLAVLDLDPNMLPYYPGIASRLSMSMRIWSNIESLEKEVKRRRLSEAELSETVLRDELTGLYNRRGFMVRARERLDAVLEASESFAVVYADMDGLKTINDRWGHDTGDIALTEAAAALTHSVRGEDIIARIGGDEYALFVRLDDAARGDALRTRLEDSLAEADAAGKRRGRQWTLSMSFGVAAYGDGKKSLERMMTEADGIQYREKERKRAERRRMADESAAG